MLNDPNDPGAIFTHKTGVKKYIKRSEIAQYGISPEMFELKLQEQQPSAYPGITQPELGKYMAERSITEQFNIAEEERKRKQTEAEKEKQTATELEALKGGYQPDKISPETYVRAKEQGIELPTIITSPVQKRNLILNQAAPVLQRIIGSAMEAPTGWKGVLKAWTGKIPGVSGGEAEYLQRDTQAFARLIASAFASEVGVATNQDVARWMKMMPNVGDTKEERVRMSEKLLEQIESETKALGIKVPEAITASRELLKTQPKESGVLPEITKMPAIPAKKEPTTLMEKAAGVQRFLGESEALPAIYSTIGGALTGGSPLGIGTGAAAGQRLKQITSKGIGAIKPSTESLGELGEMALKGGEYALIAKVLSAGTEAITNALKAKTLNPTKIAGFLREEAAKATPTINTQPILTAGERAAKLFPEAAEDWDVLKGAIPKKMPTQDLLDTLTGWGKRTWTITGTQRDKAASELMVHVYNAGRETILDQAPNVAKYTKQLREIKELPGLMKGAQKISWLVFKLFGIGKMGGL